MFCTNCGKSIPDESLFCTHCGARQALAEMKEESLRETVEAAETVAFEAPEAAAEAAGASAKEPADVALEAAEPEEDAAAAVTEAAVPETETAAVPAAPAAEGAAEPTVSEAVAGSEAAAEAEAPADALEEAPASTTVPASQEAPVLAAPGTGSARAASRKKKGAPKWLFALIAAVVVVAIAVGAFFAMRASNYSKAEELFNQQDYAAAAELYESLGNYKESASRLESCNNYLAYEEAVQLMDAGDDESLAKAAELFEGLGAFQDSADLAQECRNQLDLHEAIALMEQEKYEEAEAILSDLVNTQGMDEAYGYLMDCSNAQSYKVAMEHFEAEEYGDAYSAFMALGSFKDSANMAAQCIQDLPETGEKYHNEDYASHQCEFTIDNTGFKNTLIKLYTAGGDLVCTVFIRADESATLNLPAGTYTMNQAYGDNWFGDTDLFGNEGRYWKCKVSGSYEFTLESGNGYTMSSQTEGGAGVTNESTDAASL